MDSALILTDILAIDGIFGQRRHGGGAVEKKLCDETKLIVIVIGSSLHT